jgi:hypothetical protein
MRCARCAGEQFTKAGRDRHGRQLHRCTGCRRRTTARSGSAFSGYRFPDEVIALAVRWYLRFRLSYAEVTEWLVERGVTVDRAHTQAPGPCDRAGQGGGMARTEAHRKAGRACGVARPALSGTTRRSHQHDSVLVRGRTARVRRLWAPGRRQASLPMAWTGSPSAACSAVSRATA